VNPNPDSAKVLQGLWKSFDGQITLAEVTSGNVGLSHMNQVYSAAKHVGLVAQPNTERPQAKLAGPALARPLRHLLATVYATHLNIGGSPVPTRSQIGARPAMRESTQRILDTLIDKSSEILAATATGIRVFDEQEAEKLVNDLDGAPHACVIGCVMDMQIPAQQAWTIPHRLRTRLGFFDMPSLAKMTLDECREVMLRPTPLHRFHYMGDRLHSAVQRMHRVYNDDASRIWANNPSSALVLRRFLEFDGVGPKIASMAVNLLVRGFRVPMSDRTAIDISVDTHIRRVFPRVGLIEEGASDDAIRAEARALNPEYPGIFDMAMWDLGRETCRPDPHCHACYLSADCPSSRA